MSCGDCNTQLTELAFVSKSWFKLERDWNAQDFDSFDVPSTKKSNFLSIMCRLIAFLGKFCHFAQCRERSSSKLKIASFSKFIINISINWPEWQESIQLTRTVLVTATQFIDETSPLWFFGIVFATWLWIWLDRNCCERGSHKIAPRPERRVGSCVVKYLERHFGRGKMSSQSTPKFHDPSSTFSSFKDGRNQGILMDHGDHGAVLAVPVPTTTDNNLTDNTDNSISITA